MGMFIDKLVRKKVMYVLVSAEANPNREAVVGSTQQGAAMAAARRRDSAPAPKPTVRP